MALAMYYKYEVGLNYLFDNLDSEMKTDLIKQKFIQGTTLKITGLALTKLPNEVYEMTELTEIDVTENKFGSIPKEISKLKNLEKLCFHDNKLKTVSKALLDLPKLTELDLSLNKIKKYPKELHKLKHLKKLNIYRLSETYSVTDGFEMSPDFAKLTSLTELQAGSQQGSISSLFTNYPDFSVIKAEEGKTLDPSPEAVAWLAYEQNGGKEGVAYIFEHLNDSELNKRIIRLVRIIKD